MRTRGLVAAILLAAFLLRLASNRLLTVPPPVLDADALWYHSSAASIAAGLGYVHHLTRLPTAEWPPGYPAILAVLYRMLGPDPAWAYALNAVAGTATCWLAGRIAGLLGSQRDRIVTTAIVALLPSHVLFASVVMSETVFTTMMTALVLGALAWSRSAGAGAGSSGPGRLAARDHLEAAASRRNQSTLRWVAWGALAGAASLVRAEAVVLLALPPIALAAAGASWKRIATAGALVVATTVAIQLPWLVRNARLFGEIVPVSNSFGRTLLIGHNPSADGGMNLWSPDPTADQRDRLKGNPRLDLAVDRRLREAALRYIAENPGRELELIPRKLWLMFRGDRVWSEWYVPSNESRVQAAGIERLGRVSNLFYWALMLAAAPGFVAALVSRGPRIVLPALVVFWTAFFVVIFYGSQRFHFPLMPLVAVLAAQAVGRRANNRYSTLPSAPRTGDSIVATTSSPASRTASSTRASAPARTAPSTTMPRSVSRAATSN